MLFLIVSPAVYAEKPNDGIYNALNYGAKGDGQTLDTKAIQAAIDDCYKAGGGKVYLHKGIFVSGTIYLKSYVTLYVEAGAVLRASNNLDDFPVISSKYPSYTGEMVTNKMMIYAEDTRNIAICGRGTIDGNGDHWKEGPYGSPSFSVRPRIIHLRACSNIRISDITLFNSASWVQSYQSCKDIVISGITVNSRENKDIEKERFADAKGRNTDGLDLVDCQQVRVSDCLINSGDDAIVIKSFSPSKTCQDITIVNCIVSSNASGIKIGTETAGMFRDIIVRNCVVYDTRGDALSIMTTDGARIERINMSDITIRNIKGTAIFVGLGCRNRLYREGAEINKPWLKDITFSDIMATAVASDYCCSVNGMASRKVENITLKDIDIQFEGGKPKDHAPSVVPEQEKAYPNGRMFGKLPAFGFFIRHAKNVTLDNVVLRVAREDRRPALWCDDVEQLEVKQLRAQGSAQSSELIRLVNACGITITSSRPISPVPVFLSVYGDQSKDIVLKDNFIRNAGSSVFFEKQKPAGFIETGSIK